MKRFIPLVFLLTPTVLFSFGIGCGGNETGGNEDYEWYIRAQVNIVTPTSADSFGFNERCNITSGEIDQDIRWVIEASHNSDPFFGISISWKESFISGPGSFQAEGDSNLLPMIGREDPTKSGWFIYSFLDEGIITFTQVGYQSGDIIEGTFDQFHVYDSEVEENIEVHNGTFRCQVDEYSYW